MVQNSIFCLDGTFWTAETLVTELKSSNVVWSVCFAVFKVKVRVTAKVQNVIDFLPRWYLLNDITFCSQTYYGNASLWASVMWKMLCMVKVTVWGSYHFCRIFSTGDPFAAKFSLMGHHHKPEWLVKRLQIALFKVKFIMTVQQVTEYFCHSYVFCTTDLCSQNRCADILLLITKPNNKT